MGTWNHRLSPREPFRWTRLIEGGRFRVQLHVTGVNPWPEDPWVVQVAFTSLDEQNLQVVIQIRQSGYLR